MSTQTLFQQRCSRQTANAGRVSAAGVAVAMALVVLGFSACTGSADDAATDQAVTSRTYAIDYRLREGAAYAVSTDSLFVWGGQVDRSPDTTNSGVLIDIDTGALTPIPAAPLTPRIGSTATWTGTGFLVLGGNSGDQAHVDAAIYDTEQQQWTPLPNAPLKAGPNPSSVFLDEALVVWMSAGYHPPNETPEPQPGQVAIYEPGVNAWTVLPAPPVEIVDGTIVPFGDSFALVGGPTTRDIGVIGPVLPIQITVWDPKTDQWDEASTGPSSDNVRPVPLSDTSIAALTADGSLLEWNQDDWQTLEVDTPGTNCPTTIAASPSDTQVFFSYCELFALDADRSLNRFETASSHVEITTPSVGTFLGTSNSTLLILQPDIDGTAATLTIYTQP